MNHFHILYYCITVFMLQYVHEVVTRPIALNRSPRSSYPFYTVCPVLSYPNLYNELLLCVQEVVTTIYIMSCYINWGSYFLDTQYVQELFQLGFVKSFF